MKITRIETVEMRKGAVCYGGDPKGGWFSWLWVHIYTEDGLVGLGETYPGSSSEKAVILDDLAPILLGRDATEIEALWHDMLRAVHTRGWAGAEIRAISSVDIALWDLLGRLTGQPLYVLLGGKCRESVPVYNTCYDDSFDFNQQPVELARELLASGIGAMKIWPFDAVALANRGQSISSTEMERCMRPVRQIRESLGEQIEIAMEFHGLWNLPCAVKIARELEPYKVMWLEEMLGQDNLKAYKTLSEHVSQPLCVSERLFTRWGFRELLENGAASIIMPDIGWTGGLTEAKKIASAAETYYLPIAPHNCGGPVCHHAVWHLALATPNLMIAETVRRHYSERFAKVATNPGAVENGRLGIPQGPGLGVDLLPELLQSDAVQIESVSLGGA